MARAKPRLFKLGADLNRSSLSSLTKPWLQSWGFCRIGFLMAAFDLWLRIRDVCYWADCVAKLFSRPKRATLIQERTQTRNNDFKEALTRIRLLRSRNAAKSVATQSSRKRTICFSGEVQYRHRGVELQVVTRSTKFNLGSLEQIRP